MDRVLLCALAPSGAPQSGQEESLGCTWRPETEATKVARLLQAATHGAAKGAFGEWKYYAFLTTIFVAVLVLIGLFCFYSKFRNCAQSCIRRDPFEELEEDDFDIPWETNLIERPEPYGACISPPQSISGGNTRVSRNEDVRLPFAPADLGRRLVSGSPSHTLQGIVGPGFPSETLGERTGQGSSSESIFTIEDLE